MGGDAMGVVPLECGVNGPPVTTRRAKSLASRSASSS